MNNTYTFDCRLSCFVLRNRVHAEPFQFRFKFLEHSGRYFESSLHRAVYDSTEFITCHHTVAAKVSIRISFDNIVPRKGGDILVGPVVFRYIREELDLHRIQRLSLYDLAERAAELFHFIAEVFDLFRHCHF